jgi:type II secretory pathway pseudopilin PulG
MSKSIVVVVLLIAVFFAGFLPQYAKAKRLENELREAKQENSVAQLRDLAGLAYLQASQKNYGLAADTSTRFFDRTREVANQTPDSGGRKSLEDLLSFRDKITTELAKGDPGVLSDLQTLFLKTRQATALSAGARQPE